MGIFIKGMEMPMAGQIIEFAENVDGKIMGRISPSLDKWHEVAFIPTPHGRLIDENDVKNTFKFSEDAEYARWTLAGVLMDIEDTEAVLESEE